MKFLDRYKRSCRFLLIPVALLCALLSIHESHGKTNGSKYVCVRSMLPTDMQFLHDFIVARSEADGTKLSFDCEDDSVLLISSRDKLTDLNVQKVISEAGRSLNKNSIEIASDRVCAIASAEQTAAITFIIVYSGADAAGLISCFSQAAKIALSRL